MKMRARGARVGADLQSPGGALRRRTSLDDRVRGPGRRVARMRRAGVLLLFGEELEISQGEEILRPSKLYARVEGEGIDKVEVGGSAVIVARGEFRL